MLLCHGIPSCFSAIWCDLLQDIDTKICKNVPKITSLLRGQSPNWTLELQLEVPVAVWNLKIHKLYLLLQYIYNCILQKFSQFSCGVLLLENE